MIKQFLSELEPLINIDCGSLNPQGISAVADLMQKKYESIGWHVERADFGSKTGHGLRITNKPDANAYDLVLIGHLDTVFPDGTVALRPMSVKGERAYGPGVADMKSGVLLMHFALRNLDPKVLDNLSICVLLNPDEEIGSIYSHEWIGEHAKKSKCVLVCESARIDGSLVKARKGVGEFYLNFKGVPAHAGNDPQKGRSAILEMAQWTVALHSLSDFEKGTTLNVGIVSGGTTSNTVPEHAQAKLDIRFWDNTEFDRIEAILHKMQSAPFITGLSIEIKRAAHKPAMYPSAATELLMRVIEEAGTKVGIDIKWQAVGGGSDANFTAALGIPSLDGLGPIGGCFHSEDEYLELASIEPRIKLLQEIINKL
ncbi:peptidase M20 [Gammaproteobacteria bacterium]|nr:peptidase M20 [Gammaproteobacteria bacterium]